MVLTFFGGKGPGDAEARARRETEMRTMIEEVRSYWEGLRENGALPPRGAIDPRGLRGALQGAFLAERIAPGIARLRIAGMSLCDILGMDGRGMPLSALFDPMARARLTGLLDACFLRPAILDLTLAAETGLGRPSLFGRMILMPLAGDGGRGEMALGCLALSGQIGRAPRRLSIVAASCSALTPPRLTRTDPAQDLIRAGTQPAPLAPAFAEPAAPYRVKPCAKARSYLRLVDLEE